MEDMTRIPPHSVESEQSILGSILLDKDAIITVTETIRPDDFYKEAHKIIYECMITLSNKGEPIDLITLTEELRKQGHLNDIGGISYITSLSTIVPTTSNVKYYADIVKEKSVLRKLIKASNEIINLGYSGATKIEDVLEQAEKRIFDISQEKTSDDFKSINLVLMDAYDMIEKLYTNKSDVTGITTGFKDLNKKINGLQRTDLILVAARPAMGKTAFSLNLVQNAALKGDASVAVFSLEMSKEQLVQRMLSSQSSVELKKIKTGTLNDNDWPRIIDAMAVLSDAKIHIDDTPGIKISELRSKCRKLKIEKGLDLVLIDYLQLMEGEGNNESRQQEISKISRSLKVLAKELNCPVVALSQLSRAPEQRADHRPMLSDLRESGAIEQDADIVMFLYRDEYYHADSESKNIGEIIIAKNRHGETGSVELVWLGEVQRFGDKLRDL
ncbi:MULTISPECIES: replicative DNA helicase [Clostridioides]|uniref:replicative DNA helicase n=1 Tax=unclassified Clostridioides TaxID=2635829 RepID=UPI001D0C2C88|nr:replicative DNA helicase [Clostridioides sp. ZZV15-6388]MCC0637711.1 replicative DNA helicase [Clostridioides sp. ES-S-0001-02]MCC0641355.1 replicative DNA helicase [Clostridioides sp. ES-S-0049-03]MCC0645794.1 replicative DNA helicase [Clostridioides sp. ZZV14-6150]MCC0647382.1 replicative DNA helicase [Clostridioides sp. ZZV15-6598]MCC0653921.1 replicative DNA helicase [Clostridioides sp. ES-S-0001-03]MCC0658142.1 replicative DNA helicase [Clostridioides sp. ES-S-0123-01]MCC0662165.1 re